MKKTLIILLTLLSIVGFAQINGGDYEFITADTFTYKSTPVMIDDLQIPSWGNVKSLAGSTIDSIWSSGGKVYIRWSTGLDSTSVIYNTTSFNTDLATKTLDNIADGSSYVRMTTTERSKLSGIASGAEVNVNADWNAVSGDARILNKPNLTQYRTWTNHDSLQNLDEKSYNSLTNKPDLTVYKLKSDSVSMSGYATQFDINKLDSSCFYSNGSGGVFSKAGITFLNLANAGENNIYFGTGTNRIYFSTSNNNTFAIYNHTSNGIGLSSNRVRIMYGGNYVTSMPITGGSAGQVLTSNGNGDTYWSAGGGAGGGDITGVLVDNGITGGGTSGDVTIALGTPSTITSSTSNSATGSTHYHALDNIFASSESYTNANITVDTKGRITAASNGASGGGMVYPSGNGIVTYSGGSVWGTTSDYSTSWTEAYNKRLASVTATSPLNLSIDGGTRVLSGSINKASATGFGTVILGTKRGLMIVGDSLSQSDNLLISRTPTTDDYIGFWDVGGNAQHKVTISDLASVIGGGGGGDMYKSVYDTDSDNIVDNSEALGGTAANQYVTLTGTQTLTSKTLTTPIISATASGTTAGRLGYSGGVLSFGNGSSQKTVVTSDDSQALTNKSVNGVTLSTGAGTNNFLAGDGTYKAVSGGSQWSDDTYGISYNIANKNVGIGTASKQANSKLYVEGNISTGISNYVNTGSVYIKQFGSSTGFVSMLTEEGFIPPSIADASVGVNKLYYSSTKNRVTYKNPSSILFTIPLDPTPRSMSTTIDLSLAVNFYTSVNTSRTLTFGGICDGLSGQIQVTYVAASTLTFAAPAGYTIYIANNIWAGSGKSVLSKSSGVSIFSYYVSGTNIYINGTQNYN